MFQSEMPYDVTQANFGDMGFAGYRVGEQVQTHQAYGVGVYHNFRDYKVTVKSAIRAPAHLENSFVSPLSVFLNGLGVVQHILNGKGEQSAIDPNSPNGAVPQWLCTSSSSSPWSNHSFGGVPTCEVGESVLCPGSSNGCAGNTCCGDGSTCPSA